ncbi:hypothetical protein QBC41DRAFT_68089 [Cercophora samala]|uniref:Uncharacterized protein n=1 Tax=Cercophora samala TaxID=330535 RepID=A0AA39ZGR7_9PEZI|nr:hypothetical protein QBC41DRAFT_68089 [Cercophora samala]
MFQSLMMFGLSCFSADPGASHLCSSMQFISSFLLSLCLLLAVLVLRAATFKVYITSRRMGGSLSFCLYSATIRASTPPVSQKSQRYIPSRLLHPPQFTRAQEMFQVYILAFLYYHR